jgi:hypothetical protein
METSTIVKIRPINEEYIHKVYLSLFNQTVLIFARRFRSRDLFEGYQDVYIFPDMLKIYSEAFKREMFDNYVNLERETGKYIEGFKKGYSDYFNKVKDKPEYYQKDVFSIVSKKFMFHFGRYPYKQEMNGKISPYKWDELGEEIGRYYCAWVFVSENQPVYETLFQKLFVPEIIDNDSTENTCVVYKTGNQKVMLLDHLGVFDYLRDKQKLSNGQIGKVFSDILNIGVKDVRKCLNSIKSGKNGIEDKNDPYKSEENRHWLINVCNEIKIKKELQ